MNIYYIFEVSFSGRDIVCLINFFFVSFFRED